jgi:ATP-binding cassette subfamily C protein
MNLGSATWGKAELRVGPRGLLWVVGAFSVGVNLLLLTGPLYMLQVYDRVLASRSQPTLVALSVLAAGLFVVMGILDHARGRILARMGARLQDRMELRVLAAAQARAARQPGDMAARLALQDLDAIRALWTMPVMAHLFDMPWCPVFLLILFSFGAPMGWLALGGACLLFVLALLTRSASAKAGQAANLNFLQAEGMASEMARLSETLSGLGMTGAMARRWKHRRQEGLGGMIRSADRALAVSMAGRVLRMALQSAMLGLGALLVLQGQLSAGAMVAGSILLGRSLQPVELIIANWHHIVRWREAQGRLAGLLAATPPAPPRHPLPRPAARLELLGLSVAPPGGVVPVLRGVSYGLGAGQILGVLGPSGAGKSCLARALSGAWPALSGAIRLGGATPDQFGPDGYGRLIGYVPQRLSLVEGTVAQNIARLDPTPDPETVISAARRAGAHEMILRLPDGFDTPIGPQGGPLSGGQIQLIGLARALYGDPVLLVLDEPHANLDAAGFEALNLALRTHRAAGGCAVIMAHQAALLAECDQLMLLERGQMRSAGPREAVLRGAAQMLAPGLRAVAPGGAA